MADNDLLAALTKLAGPDTKLADLERLAVELELAGISGWQIERMQAAGLELRFGPDPLPRPKTWFLAVQRWPVGCRRCPAEVKRGELCNLGRLPGGEWTVECGTCRELDPRCERAQEARKRAVAKEQENGDAEQLIEAMVALSSPDLHERIEDLLLAVVAAEGRE